MKTSTAGRARIAEREGVRLKRYRDSVGIWTIGTGHTAAAGPPDPNVVKTITMAENDAILARDLAKFEAGVERAITRPMTQNQFDALVSLAFNIGLGAFAKSSVVRRFNAGDIDGAARSFLLWNKAGGRVIPGLVKRRESEKAQFEGRP